LTKFNPVTYCENVLKDIGFHRGKLHKLACERFLKDWDHRKDKGWIYDEKSAEQFYRFAEICKHWKGAGFAGDSIYLADYQKFMYGNLLGWKMENGLVRFRDIYHQVAKKNYKTTGLAVYSLFHLSKSGEPGAQVWIGSNREEQARIVVNDAGQIVSISPLLQNKYKLSWHQDTVTGIFYAPNSARMRPLSKDANRQDGFHPSLGIIDEFHESKTGAVRDNIRSGSGGRYNFQMIVITTAGFNIGGPCWNLRQTGIEILKGIKSNDRRFILIDELDSPEDEWENQEAWVKPNPRIDSDPLFLSEFLVPQYNIAKDEGGQSIVSFKTKNLDWWTNIASTWLPDEAWIGCDFERFTLGDFKGRQVWMGLDLASGIDMNSACWISPNTRTGRVDIFWQYWHTESRVRASKDDADYIKWNDEGYIKTTQGAGPDVIDHEQVSNDIIEWLGVLDVQAIDYDTKAAHHGVIQNILKSGFENCRPLSQGTSSLGEPINFLEAQILAKKMNFGGNPVSRWMSGNCVMYVDTGGYRRPSKKGSNTRIDGIQAFVNAIAGYLTPVEEDEKVQIFV